MVTKSKRLRWAAKTEEGRRVFKILTGKLTGKITLGRSNHGWEDNIRMYFKEIAVFRRNWINSPQDRDIEMALWMLVG